MITTVVFSKNRASQLDLLLRSIIDNFKEIGHVHVLYTTTDDFFEAGYKKLKSKFGNFITLHKEKEFKTDFVDILKSNINRYFVAFTDDDVVIRNVELNGILHEFENNNKIYCINLRLGLGLNYSYTQDKIFRIPPLTFINDYILWNWTLEHPASEWGYPHAYEGHIVRMSEFIKFIEDLDFDFPGNLESSMNHHRRYEQPFMISFLKPRVLSVANNKVQLGRNRYGARVEFSPVELNKKYLNNIIIDTSNLYNIDISSPHAEIPYLFTQEDK